MGRQINWDAVPETNVVPDGTYQLSIVELREAKSKAQALMYIASFEVVAPEEFAGMPLTEYYSIGTPEDPDADQDATWRGSFGARNMRKMLASAQVPLDGDMDNTCAAAEQAQFVAFVAQQVDDGSKDPQYKGRVSNRIQSYYKLGEKALSVAAEVPAAVAPAAKPKLAAVPQGRAPAPVAPRAPTPAAKAPPPPAAHAAAAKPVAPAKPKAVEMVVCAVCKNPDDKAALEEAAPDLACDGAYKVPKTDFLAHVEKHAELSAG